MTGANRPCGWVKCLLYFVKKKAETQFGARTVNFAPIQLFVILGPNCARGSAFLFVKWNICFCHASLLLQQKYSGSCFSTAKAFCLFTVYKSFYFHEHTRCRATSSVMERDMTQSEIQFGTGGELWELPHSDTPDDSPHGGMIAQCWTFGPLKFVVGFF